MESLKRFIREVHRRSIWQVLGVYVLTSWVVYQVVLAFYEGLGLPDWVVPTALALLLVGLPVVLATALVQEGGPGAADAAPDPSVRPTPDEGFAGIELELTDAERAGATAADPSGDAPAADPTEAAPASTDAVPASADAAPDRAAGTPSVDAAAGGHGERRGRLERLFTWRKAITGGVLAFAVLGLATTGFMGMRALGIGPAATLMTSGALDARDRIVLADFRNPTSDSTLGRLVTEALRIDLVESPVVTVVERSYVAEVLQRMQRPSAVVDAALAGEVALREGMKAVLEGEVGRLGGGYVLAATLVSAETGEALAGFRETAADSTELIAAIDRLSRSIREKVGESLKSVRSGKPLSRVTTSSLPALRLYSQGLYEEAIAADSTFAMAWRSLGVRLSNSLIERSRMVEAYTRAYELRDRLSGRERGLVTADYFKNVEGDPAAASAAHRRVLATHPDDGGALNNLATTHIWSADPEGAEPLLRHALERWPKMEVARVNLVESLLQQGRIDDARAALDSAVTAIGRTWWIDVGEILLTAELGEYDRLDSLITEMEDRHGRSPAALRLIEFVRVTAAGDRGHLRAAAEHARSHDRLAAAHGWDAQTLMVAAAMAQLRLRATGRADLTRLDRLVDERLEALHPLDRPYPALIEAYAVAGRAGRARTLLTEYDDRVPPDRRGTDRALDPLLRGLVALSEGRVEPGIEALREAEARRGPMIHLGEAYERAGRPDSALAAYARFADAHAPYEIVTAPPGARAHAIWRLAQLHEEHGDPDRAAAYYARFLNLWQDADPQLQPRVDAARRALARLTGEGAGVAAPPSGG